MMEEIKLSPIFLAAQLKIQLDDHDAPTSFAAAPQQYRH
jgi:hypothetical protein